MLRLFIFVAIWWISNAITAIASKNEIVSGNKTPAFADMRWVELTTFQFLLGGIVSVVWFNVVKGQSICLSEENKKQQLIVILGNLFGHLSVNASYAFVSSSSTQIIESCEPIFMFLLSICFGYKQQPTRLTIPMFFSLFLMFLGTCIIVVRDISFNLWGALAAVLSSIAFPLRNIVLTEELDNSFKSPLKQYSILCFYGFLLLCPVTCVKLIVSRNAAIFRSKSYIPAAIFHYVYNIASITVLQSISPLNHAILNFTKRTFVIMAKIEYFNTTLALDMLFGCVVLIIGQILYHFMAGNLAKMTSRPRKTIHNVFGLVGIASVFFAAFTFVHLERRVSTPSLTTRTRLPSRMNKIATSWVYQHPMPRDVVENIKTIHYQNPEIPIHVYCGTSRCTRTIERLNNTNITANFLVIPDLVRNTSLETWFRRHPLYKILTGNHFEDHLQEVVRLAHLWHHGGIFIDATVRMNNYSFPRIEEEWVTISSSTSPANTTPVILQVSSCPPRHPFIKNLFEIFGSEYQNRMNEHTTDIFRQTVWNIYKKFCNTRKSCPRIVTVEMSKIVESDQTRNSNHFGTLSYDTRVRKVNSANLDDEIQGFPGVQFLPYVDFFLDREQQNIPNGKDNFTIFFNSWWGDRDMNWPPPQNIHPIMLSIYVDPTIQHIVAKDVDFLKRKSPIGCRDASTLDFFTKLGVDSFFSGWMTLLLKSPNYGKNSKEDIYIVDVNPKFRAILPSEIRRRAISLTHVMTENVRFQTKARFVAAYERIERYSRAKLVITQKINCALSCVAMGIPVIFINSRKMAGGGDSKNASSRVVGLTKLFHSLDIYNMSMEDAKRWLHKFNWDDPPKNPNLGTFMRMRATLWNVIRENRVLYEVAHTFGVIPLTSRRMTGPSKLLFHLIFTTSRNTILAKKLTGVFNWRHWRCVESIFHHHASSKVIIHSNTLHQSTFDVLTEAGYDLEVRKYNLTTLAQNTPAEIFVKKEGKAASSGQHWYSHETDLLRLLLLYRFGGVYLDTDVIVVRPMSNLIGNVLGYEDEGIANGAVMMFEKGHPFLEACLERFAKHYDGRVWGANGPLLLTRVWKLWPGGSDKSGVKIVSIDLFYMFRWNEVSKECFHDTSGPIFEAKWKIVQNVAYAVHLNSKISGRIGANGERLKDGTICKHLLNSYCVLCNKEY